MMRMGKWLASPLWIYVGLPLLCGLIALHRGQDSNFDLQNYHLYNPYAWLNGRIGRDLAAAGLQSYFNPLLDVPYYVLSQRWPAPLLGFVMGAFQGLAGVAVYLIARRLLPASKQAPMWLAIAGVFTANFWTELGNTMGDNGTATLVLAGILFAVVAVKRGDGARATQWLLLVGGLFAGAATGLKLTNAPFAVALGVAALAAWPGAWFARIRSAVSLGVGAAVGFISVGGYWLWRMWAQFGNPLFPQFGRVFTNPLTGNGGISDTSWLPTHWWEYLAWPIIMSVNPLRVGQLHLHSSIWPVFYALMIATVVIWVIARIRLKSVQGVQLRGTGAGSAQALVVWFVVVGYALWMMLFSISRYLVAADLLVPLASWILISQFNLTGRWQQAAIGVLALCAVFTLSGPRRIWEHNRWASQAFTVSTPALADPARTLIFMGSATPQAWMIPFFPSEVTFVEVGGAFPQGPGFLERVVEMRKAAKYVYVLRDPKPNPWWKVGEDAKKAGLASAAVVINEAKCQTYAAAIGRDSMPYQLCPVD